MTRRTHRTVRLALAAAGACIALLLTTGFTPATSEASSNSITPFSAKLAPAATANAVVASSDTAAFPAASAHALTATTIPAQTRTLSSTGSGSGSSTTARSGSGASELEQARAILAGYIAKYPILAGASVSFGDAKGYQAICYYRSGRIVISPTHTASLSRIIRHEVGHIMDWRDNGVIDWGENIPAL